MSSVPVTAVSPTGRLAARRALRAAEHTARILACAASLAAALGAVGWLVLAAAARPSALSPPTLRGGGHAGDWLLGPLHGLLGQTASAPARLHADLATALVVLAVAWVVAWATAPAVPVRVIAGVLVVANVALLLGPPQPLTDVFNYLLYGRMAGHGINPYTALPLAARNDPAFALSNWHHLSSPYGPLQTLLNQAFAGFSLATELWIWKLVVVASSLGTLALVAHLARRLGRNPQRALVAVGLCPAVLAIGVGGFHNDGPAVLCLLGAATAMLRDRDGENPGGSMAVTAGVLAVAAAGLKPSFAIAVPIVVLGCGRRLPALAAATWATAIVGLVVWRVYGGALPALGDQAALVTPLSMPNLLGLAAGHGGADAAVRGAARHALALLCVVAVAVVAWRREHALSALGVVLLGAVLTLSWVMPWYLGWALPFLALGRPRALVPVAVVAAVWLGVGGMPQVPQILHSAGYYPTRLATGRANHAYLLERVQ